MLATRIITAAVLVPLVLAALFMLSPRNWGYVTLAVIAIAASEWARIVGFSAVLRVAFIVVTAIVGVALLSPAAGFAAGWPAPIVTAVCGAATVFWLAIAPFWLRQHWRAAASKPAAAIVGWLVLIAAWMAIVQLQSASPWRVLAAMAVVWIADTMAYFSGRALGRHKLAPSISPGKTWEGVAGGLVAVAIYAVALLVLQGPAVGIAADFGVRVAWLVLALIVAGMSVVGDLFESLLKRQAGVKDSGTLLPGHGGVLDRIDALLAAMPPFALAAVVLLK
jgi:phosphatidate cytidylyltransferase